LKTTLVSEVEEQSMKARSRLALEQNIK